MRSSVDEFVCKGRGYTCVAVWSPLRLPDVDCEGLFCFPRWCWLGNSSRQPSGCDSNSRLWLWLFYLVLIFESKSTWNIQMFMHAPYTCDCVCSGHWLHYKGGHIAPRYENQSQCWHTLCLTAEHNFIVYKTEVGI